jgi:hypothetical protein
MDLKSFACTACGSIDLLPGGTCGHLCNPCKLASGRSIGLTAQQQAHKAVARARACGSLPSPCGQSCADCGGAATEYEHRDYSRPLAVDPICRRCNLRRGPALNHTTAKAA